MDRIKKILYDMRSSLKSEMRTRWMTEDEVKSNNELQSQITEAILIIEREQKEIKQQSNCNLPHVRNSLPDGFSFEDEHGHKVTVIGYIKEWVVVEDLHHEEPYCLSLGYVQTIYDEMVAEGNDY